MKIGFANDPRLDVVTEIEWAAEHGFDFVDLFLEPDAAAVERIDPPAIRKCLARHGLGSVGHLAWYLPIGSPMPQLRRAAVDTAAEYLRAFEAAGIRAVTIHANWPPRLFTMEQGIRWQIESLAAVMAAAEAARIGMMYEPVASEWDSAENLKRILDALPRLKCHLDTGHANLWGRSPETMLLAFADRLAHVHLHDNDGRSDLHLPPGTGTIEWDAVVAALRTIGYDGTVTLEVFSRDRDYLLLAKDKFKSRLG